METRNYTNIHKWNFYNTRFHYHIISRQRFLSLIDDHRRFRRRGRFRNGAGPSASQLDSLSSDEQLVKVPKAYFLEVDKGGSFPPCEKANSGRCSHLANFTVFNTEIAGIWIESQKLRCSFSYIKISSEIHFWNILIRLLQAVENNDRRKSN